MEAPNQKEIVAHHNEKTTSHKRRRLLRRRLARALLLPPGMDRERFEIDSAQSALVFSARKSTPAPVLVALHPLGRMGTRAEVTELTLWIASDKASLVTGAYYSVDGGYLAQGGAP